MGNEGGKGKMVKIPFPCVECVLGMTVDLSITLFPVYTPRQSGVNGNMRQSAYTSGGPGERFLFYLRHIEIPCNILTMSMGLSVSISDILSRLPKSVTHFMVAPRASSLVLEKAVHVKLPKQWLQMKVVLCVLVCLWQKALYRFFVLHTSFGKSPVFHT